jgi:outer membrane protein OmpA-like peptidoglycan-associated protein/tetratricopeptide (TPR) repeat protein
MKIKSLVYSVFLSTLAFQGYSQKGKVATANKNYDRYAYVDAIATYEKVAEKGYKEEQLFQKLGNAYYFNADLAKASKWYDELFAMNPEQEAEYYYRYAQTLKSIGDYAKANKMMEKFNAQSGNDQRAKLYANNKNYLEGIKHNSRRFEIADAGVNSKFSDYGSTVFEGQLVFTSARDTGGVSKSVFRWTGKSFTNLYGSVIRTDGEMETPERFAKRINSKLHESTPVFTKDGKTMYFTRNNYLDGKLGKNANKMTLLKLYRSVLEEGKWVDVTELSFNSNEYNVAHPALSVDEKTLYFASDMPGTLGQSDLFRVAINADGSFGTPENLGTAINTEGRETFPYIAQDNQLYFASDGHPGLGGLDVYVARIDTDNSFYDIQNLGEPLNSKQDDFGFYINSKDSNGFFTSNRPGGNGSDDIYKFNEIRKLKCEQVLSGIITDQETGEAVAATKVSLFDSHFKLIKESSSDEKGQYHFDAVECKKAYYVRAEKEEYQTKETSVEIEKVTGKIELALQLEKRIKPIGVGTDLAKTLNIPVIYFDLDKSLISKKAEFELAKVVAVMQQYPKMKIDVRAHTDSRQTAKYNENLSDRRAKATLSWLEKKGIDASRLTAKGYGESQLINGCSDGVKCSEKEHQANRRSEFVIVSME